ncbi:MAG: serine/threonine protein phosphatase [Eubacteriales bacterium]|nr:serine/threonine protein phosphatase [Eubacteriales bacterium]MDD4389518.1 serine/threonine protein phosphatase [Eubacteriales bacterium]
MNTKGKLEKVYKYALNVEFDNSSKIVFFSDVHRGDDGSSDEFARNKHIYNYALNYYFKEDYTYVEIGDGDELWEQKNFEHIRNAHAVTFNRLKRFYDTGRMYMLFGNHNDRYRRPEAVKKDMYYVYDEYIGDHIDLFPGIKVHEALVFKHKDTNQEIFVVHGHQGDLLNDQLSSIAHFGVKFFWRFLHIVGFRYAASPAKSRRKRHKIEKNYSKWNKDNGKIIICGHTHRVRFPSPEEGAYFNSGCCMHPRGITCIELDEGQISLIAWRVHTMEDGTMYIRRTVLVGPEPIENYKNHTTVQQNLEKGESEYGL